MSMLSIKDNGENIAVYINKGLWDRWKALIGRKERISVWLSKGRIYISPRELLTQRLINNISGRELVLRKNALEILGVSNFEDWRAGFVDKDGIKISYLDEGDGHWNLNEFVAYKSQTALAQKTGKNLILKFNRKMDVDEIIREYGETYEWIDERSLRFGVGEKKFVYGKTRIVIRDTKRFEPGIYKFRLFWDGKVEIV